MKRETREQLKQRLADSLFGVGTIGYDLEHGKAIHPDDIRTFRELGLLPDLARLRREKSLLSNAKLNYAANPTKE